MSGIAVGIGLSALAGGAASIYAANENKEAAENAANTQAAAARDANQVQWDMFEKQRTDTQPWRQAGARALSQLNDPQLTDTFDQSDFKKDPGYQFRMDEGLKAVERSASAGGRSADGGRTMKELTRYGQGFASNEYQNAYNRFNMDRDQKYNKLAGIAGVGQTANAQINQLGANTAGQVGNNLMGAANAQGAAGIAAANANSQMVGNLANTGMNSWMMYQMGNS